MCMLYPMYRCQFITMSICTVMVIMFAYQNNFRKESVKDNLWAKHIALSLVTKHCVCNWQIKPSVIRISYSLCWWLHILGASLPILLLSVGMYVLSVITSQTMNVYIHTCTYCILCCCVCTIRNCYSNYIVLCTFMSYFAKEIHDDVVLWSIL